MIRYFIYKTVMRIAHKFNWHYAPPIYPDGDTQLWCKWCGFRQTIKRRNRVQTMSDDMTKKVAVIDGIGAESTVDIYIEHDNGDIENLDWPENWPSWVTTEFLKQHGFEVISA